MISCKRLCDQLQYGAIAGSREVNFPTSFFISDSTISIYTDIRASRTCERSRRQPIVPKFFDQRKSERKKEREREKRRRAILFISFKLLARRMNCNAVEESDVIRNVIAQFYNLGLFSFEKILPIKVELFCRAI